ncbi:hypothetical protein LAUMK13_02624 [Mycobacterium innocens]|uniref:Uncharacterized protein n=1 Tax=Mycobacterium innocens TaxID=2341083 RepID=A0A498Q099_9MYCO|nr:hypothetical protein LAUMK13_02624 [Mycobacterium innocens]
MTPVCSVRLADTAPGGVLSGPVAKFAPNSEAAEAVAQSGRWITG